MTKDVCDRLGTLIVNDPIAQAFSRGNGKADPKAVLREKLGAADAFPSLATLLTRHAADAEVTGAVAFALYCLLDDPITGSANIARARATVGLEAALEHARSQFPDQDSPRWDVKQCAGGALDLMKQ